jgi:hypothetical protein
MALVMVLNDGETFSDLAGCMIIDVPDDWSVDKIEDELDNYNTIEQDPDFKEIGTFGENPKIENDSISFQL